MISAFICNRVILEFHIPGEDIIFLMHWSFSVEDPLKQSTNRNVELNTTKKLLNFHPIRLKPDKQKSFSIEAKEN